MSTDFLMLGQIGDEARNAFLFILHFSLDGDLTLLLVPTPPPKTPTLYSQLPKEAGVRKGEWQQIRYVY